MAGGAQMTTHHLAEELARRGHDVTVVALAPSYRPPAPPFAAALGYRVVTSETPAEVLAGMAGELDCVIVGGYHDRTVPWAEEMLGAAGGVPAVLYLHDVGALDLTARPELGIGAIVTVSRFLGERVRARGAEATCIEPIVDPDHYRVDTSRRVALFVNPVAQKGVDAALGMAEARPDIPFAFVRCWRIPDAEDEPLRVRARAAGNVELRDTVWDPRELYRDARVLLVPSRYPEGWPRVTAEAQASGIPVVSADVGGASEAANGAAVLVAPDAPDARWAEALGRLWDDAAEYDARAAAAAAAAARQAVSARSVGDRFEALLAGLAPSRR